jgi:hypothetical protein
MCLLNLNDDMFMDGNYSNKENRESFLTLCIELMSKVEITGASTISIFNLRRVLQHRDACFT